MIPVAGTSCEKVDYGITLIAPDQKLMKLQFASGDGGGASGSCACGDGDGDGGDGDGGDGGDGG